MPSCLLLTDSVNKESLLQTDILWKIMEVIFNQYSIADNLKFLLFMPNWNPFSTVSSVLALILQV